MAGYESAQLVESVHDEGVEHVAVQRQRAVPWRRVGLAAAVVGTLGAAVGTSLLSKPPTPAQQMRKMRKSLLQAFSSRALTEAADLKTRIGFTFAEEDAGDPSAMSIDATVETKDPSPDTMTMKLIFNAQEGKGELLVEKMTAVVKGVKDFFKEMSGQEAADMIGEMVTVSAGEEDEGILTFVPPADEDESLAMDEMSEDLESPPKFTASLTTGRSFVEMYEHAEDNIAMLPQGVSGHLDATFNPALLVVANDLQMPRSLQRKSHDAFDSTMRAAKILEVFKLFEMNYVFRYRAGDDTVKAFDELPNLSEAVEMIAKSVAQIPKSILDPIKDLADVADGVKSFEITGLPHKYGILAEFKNFHILPILKNIIDDIDAEEDGSAPAPAPEDGSAPEDPARK